MQQHKTIYVPISVKDRLPEQNDRYYVCVADGKMDSFLFKDGAFRYYNGKIPEYTTITHWLEKRDNMILCKKSDLEEIFDAGYDMGTGNWRAKDLDEILQSKGIKP